MKLVCTNPFLLLLIPICLVFLLFLSKKMRIKNKKEKRRMIIVRFLVFTSLILALSDLYVEGNGKATTTIFLVDVSDSMKEYLEEEEEFIKAAISDMKKQDKMGVVAFGKEALVDQFVTEKQRFYGITTNPMTTATDFETAIAKALSLMGEQGGKRIVLLTDGLSNEGNLKEIQSALASEQVEFKVKFYEKSIEKEVYLSNLQIPEKIREGENFTITVDVFSTEETKANIHLYSGNQWRGTKEVILQKGENQFVFQEKAEGIGFHTYRATVEAREDTSQLNNEYSAYTDVVTPDRILLIEGSKGNGKALEKILDTSGYDYKVVSTRKAPDTIGKMLQYKTILLNNVFASDLNQGFLNYLETYIKDYGGGLIAIGGDSSFALGGYENTVLEQVLPVYMHTKGEQEIPKMAMTMVIDHSGSMTSEIGSTSALNLAKQSAIVALENFRETDEVGVLAFDDKFQWVVPMEVLEEKTEAQSKIASISEGGGTSIYPALQEAIKEMKKSDAKIKHILLLTDGQDGYHNYEPLMEDANQNKISISTIAVGSGADKKTLKWISEKGNGRYYYVDGQTDLPKIFTKEVYLSRKNYLVQREFTPVVVNSDPILNGIVEEGLPTLLGYVASSEKENAVKLLESDTGDPILTKWQYGLGKTIAFNSDATNQWTRNYAGWSKYGTLWKRMIDDTISDVETEEDSLAIHTTGDQAVLTYHTNEYEEQTSVIALATNEKGDKKEVILKPIMPGVFEGSFTMEEQGVWNINVRNENNGKVVRNRNGIAIKQYSKEYRYDGDEKELRTLMQDINGKEIKDSAEVFTENKKTSIMRYSLYPILIGIAMIAFLIDIAIRRFRRLSSKRWVTFSRKISSNDEEKQEVETEIIEKKEKVLLKKEKNKDRKKRDKKQQKEENILDVETLLKKKEERNKH